MRERERKKERKTERERERAGFQLGTSKLSLLNYLGEREAAQPLRPPKKTYRHSNTLSWYSALGFLKGCYRGYYKGYYGGLHMGANTLQ